MGIFKMLMQIDLSEAPHRQCSVPLSIREYFARVEFLLTTKSRQTCLYRILDQVKALNNTGNLLVALKVDPYFRLRLLMSLANI